MIARLSFLLPLVVVACSSSSGNDDSGAVWPDGLSSDKGAADGAVVKDRAADRMAADLGPVLDGPSSGWGVALDPATIGVDLHAVACVAGHVYAVGDTGVILHRPPNGEFETQQLDEGAAADLYTVAFADTSYGAVAGKSSHIWKTEDLGKSWATAPQCSAFVFEAFFGLHLYSATEGFGAGVAVNDAGAGTKYFAGASWVCIEPTYAGKIFYDVFRLQDSGWAVGDTGGEIYRTEDKGLTWVVVDSGSDAVLRAVFFANDKLGAAVGDGGTILRSVDGKGESWSKVESQTSEDLWDVYFWNGQLGWVVGDSGTILYTDDGGASWKPQSSPVTARLESVCFNSASEGWAVGQGGTLLRTDTAGQ